VMIDAGVAEVFVGEGGEALGGGSGSEGAGLYCGEEFEESGFVHLYSRYGRESRPMKAAASPG
jgi:hypothetical protein